MKPQIVQLIALALAAQTASVLAGDLSLESAPPVVVKTTPVAGAADVDPGLSEIQVTFSKDMAPGSWAWCYSDVKKYPTTTGDPHYLADHRTCVLPVKLEPGKSYEIWINTEQNLGFKDTADHPAIRYLLAFSTGGESLFTADQRRVMEWTDAQFRGFFDSRTFENLSEQERASLETKLLNTLKGPQNREYFEAISTLGALRSKRAVPALSQIAFERVDKNNRDRWMAVRALGLIEDKSVVPDMIHLVYHGNVNTHWWAQISLVRLTGKNFGGDWNAWGKWWNEQNGQPRYDAAIIRWWNGQVEPDKLAKSLEESDQKFLAGMNSR